MTLKELLNRKLIKKCSLSPIDTEKKMKKAYKQYNFVQLHLKPPG